nr:MAG TPA: hypothetical protein [Caudoviricetes sp.]
MEDSLLSNLFYLLVSNSHLKENQIPLHKLSLLHL